MTPERWERIKDLYHAARSRADRDRTEFLAEASAGDEELRRQVQALLDQPVSTGSFDDFLGAPMPALAARLRHDSDASLLTGRRLGVYQVQALIGSGGMGDVYRAHDTRLDRDVAIKVLSRAFAADPNRLVRFEREARMVATLNDPHIAAIHGVEESDGVRGLVLELVEGETLAERLAHSAGSTRPGLRLEEALDYAWQIAAALEAAHQKGITHRDLKPANVKVTPNGVVKLLDFGIAKVVTGDGPGIDLTQALTATAGVTIEGLIVGTPGYMSPEQARGNDVDTRTDIWAFGCLLYELLTGRRAFQGETLSDTIAAVLEREPDWKALPGATPASIRELLRRCLHKDATRRLQDIAEARRTIEHAQRGSNRWRVAAIAAATLAALAIGIGVWWRAPARAPERTEWVQITKLPDSVIHPALSPDGRMVAFIRGPSRFLVPFGPGQVYVKILPDGEPVQLTHDSVAKMSPVFSPDGARIAYTTVDQQFGWDTWTVPVLGGEPQRWLRNASGLVWTGPQQVLFSEIRKNPHMGIVAAGESRIGAHDVYLPEHELGMAHRSYASPDRKWVLLVEMDQDHAWIPCRLVPMDGTSSGRQVGPLGAGCTFAAWSPDGKWMYVTSNAGGANHIWRQRFPDGQPQQMTFGPTEEEGIAMAPDGRSFVTAVALRNASVWLHDANGEREISLEGNAVDAKFTPDGKRLLYKVVGSLGEYPLPGEVRVADLEAGRSQPLIPGFQALDYDISPDGQQVVIEAVDRDGTSRLWLATFDRRFPPRQIPNVQGRQPRFGPGGEIFFRRTDEASGFVHRIRPDGTEMQKAIDQPIPLLGAVSRDGQWIMGWTARPGNDASAAQLFPLSGGSPIPIAGFIQWEWSPAGDSLSVSGGPIPEGRSYIIPLARGEALPRMPAEGLRSERDVAQLPGARKIDAVAVPGPSADVYAFYRTTIQRNLYRIPIP